MSDQGRWFKLWTTALDDPILSVFPNDEFARWAKFGAYLKVHGQAGQITLTEPPPGLRHPLEQHFQVESFSAVIMYIRMFPNCVVTRVTNADVTYMVSWLNWQQFQGDFSRDRVRKYRQKQRESVTPKKRGEEKRGEEKRIPPSSPPIVSWGTAEGLVALYNLNTPDECPAVEVLSPGRRQRARAALKLWPEKIWWEQVFAEIHQSKFLRGLKPASGHEHFMADLDWLLAKGKDGVENAVKVWEGKYRDG